MYFTFTDSMPILNGGVADCQQSRLLFVERLVSPRRACVKMKMLSRLDGYDNCAHAQNLQLLDVFFGSL